MLDAESLSDAESAALDAIVSGIEAWSPLGPIKGEPRELYMAASWPFAKPGQLEGWLGGLVAAGHRRATLDALESAGWVVPWALPRGWPRGLCLSPIGASTLGLGLVDRWVRMPGDAGWTEVARWAPRWLAEGWATMLPRGGRIGAGFSFDPVGGGDPADLAEQAELVEVVGALVRRFESTIGTDPDGALSALQAAESLLEGVGAEVRKRWLFDGATGLPKLIRGALVPVDARIGATRPRAAAQPRRKAG